MSWLYPYLLATGTIVFLMMVWLVVQLAWKRSFPEIRGDVDVLASRPGCHACTHDGDCEVRVGGHEETDPCDLRRVVVH